MSKQTAAVVILLAITAVWVAFMAVASVTGEDTMDNKREQCAFHWGTDCPDTGQAHSCGVLLPPYVIDHPAHCCSCGAERPES